MVLKKNRDYDKILSIKLKNAVKRPNTYFSPLSLFLFIFFSFGSLKIVDLYIQYVQKLWNIAIMEIIVLMKRASILSTTNLMICSNIHLTNVDVIGIIFKLQHMILGTCSNSPWNLLYCNVSHLLLVLIVRILKNP